jgi:CRISPR-associated protein Cmr6
MRSHIIQQLAPRRNKGEHPGLLLTRFLAAQEDDGADKRALFEAARAAGQCEPLRQVYRLAFERWLFGLPAPRATAEVATLPSTRVIVGLGNKGTIDAGLRLHHTYGVPQIPGSALKGLACHYCAEVWGAEDKRYAREGDFHTLLFGTTDDSGVIRFEDAWLHLDCLGRADQGLLRDVMTPHHQKWQTDPEVAPTDFDSPVPVPFLSVAGRFHLAVCWQGPDHSQAQAWTNRALELLRAALADWGAGGKTSSGYGRLTDAVPKPSAAPAATAATRTASPAKRSSGTPARVTIVGGRGAGFDVQEEGRPPGTLTVGIPPAGVNVEVGSTVDVLVHNDDPRKPQYRWPAAPKASPGKGGGK